MREYWMPIHEQSEPEPQVDMRMLEFVQRRREEQAVARRQRVQVVAIIALGIIGIVLTVSNAVLVSRLVARPVTPPAVVQAPVRSAPSTPRVAPAERARPTPEAAPPPAAAVRAEPRSAAPSAAVRDDARPAASVREVPRPEARAVPPVDASGDGPVPALPERSARASRPGAGGESRPPSAPRESLSSAVEMDPALRTAQWMMRTYGPLDAETRALAAAEFYTGDEGTFWHRVVSHVRAER
jgi:hypothetical protein